MLSHLIVLDPPSLDDLPRLREARKPVHIQGLVPKLAVETLDESIVHRTSWRDEVKLDSAPVSPLGAPSAAMVLNTSGHLVTMFTDGAPQDLGGCSALRAAAVVWARKACRNVGTHLGILEPKPPVESDPPVFMLNRSLESVHEIVCPRM